ncbi:MAG: hypothetical protein ACREEP_12525 [Dongiaceae bacterium]
MIRDPLDGDTRTGGMGPGSQSVHGAGVTKGVVGTNPKHILIGAAVVAAFVLGGLWLFLRHQPAQDTLSAFQATCIEGQRRGISGGALPLDDETEGRLLAFCDCVAQKVSGGLSQQDLAAIRLDQSSPQLDAKLGAIFKLCRARDP